MRHSPGAPQFGGALSVCTTSDTKGLTMRYALLSLLALAACSTDKVSPTAPARVPDAPSLTWVFDTPRPTMVSAQFIEVEVHGLDLVRVTWNDNTTDESYFAFYATGGNTAPNTANAGGVAGTGARSADVAVTHGSTEIAVGAVWVASPSFLRTPYSAAVAITSGSTTLTATKVKGKH